MTLRTKINIDRILGFTVVLILNYLSLLLRKKKFKNDVEIKNILVCKFMGMGSIIQATPLMITLKNNYPDAKITFLTAQKNFELLKSFPFIENILTIEDSSIKRVILSTFRTFSYLFAIRVDVFIDLEIHSYFSKLFVLFSRANH